LRVFLSFWFQAVGVAPSRRHSFSLLFLCVCGSNPRDALRRGLGREGGRASAASFRCREARGGVVFPSLLSRQRSAAPSRAPEGHGSRVA
jgi:hypothetical protein